MRLKLSDAQISALQCRDGDPDWPAGMVLDDSHLGYPDEDACEIEDYLSEACDAEDEHADILRREGEIGLSVLTRRASRSLLALSNRVMKAAR